MDHQDLHGNRHPTSGSRRVLPALALLVLTAVLAAAERPPNLVLVEIDDLAIDALGCYGNPVARTPHLDAVAKRGLRFTAAYGQGSHVGAVCLPSRTMLLTGRSWMRGGALAPAMPTLARAHSASGWASMRSGKGGNYPKQLSAGYDRDETQGDAAAHADRLIAFARAQAGKKPLFLHLAATEPHDPQDAPAELYAGFRPEDMPLPPGFLPVHPFDNGEMAVRDERTLPWPRTADAVRGKLARYHASLHYLDQQVGRLLAALAELGELERTIVVAIADNGLSLGDHGLLGKQNLYERGGMHLALIVAGPGVAAGTSAALVYNLDLYPTLCELTGAAPPPKDIDGRSFAAVVRGQAREHRAAIVTGYRDVQRAVRDARWKLIRYPRINRSQLFDLAGDPDELRDLAGRPEHAAEEQRLLALLERECAGFGDTAPLSVAQPGDGVWTPPPGGR